MRIALISPAHGHRHILDLQYPRTVFLGASASTCMPMVLNLGLVEYVNQLPTPALDSHTATTAARPVVAPACTSSLEASPT
jgi:hypothetical protein